LTIRARFGSTVCALVTNGLGIAIIDEFTLASDQWPNIRALDIVEPTAFQTYVVHRQGHRAVELRRAFRRCFAQQHGANRRTGTGIAPPAHGAAARPARK
jgi:DNA-binding transcriptional LysR family regulator